MIIPASTEALRRRCRNIWWLGRVTQAALGLPAVLALTPACGPGAGMESSLQNKGNLFPIV